MENIKIHTNFILLKCDNCCKEFYRQQCFTKNKAKHFCSNKCRHESLTNEKFYITVTCDQCGKEFKKYKIYEKNNINHFCSSKCYNTFRKVYMHFNDEARRIAFKNYKHKCECCNWDKVPDILQVHHINENRKINTLENLIILCPICHRIIHSGWGELNNRKLIMFNIRKHKRYASTIKSLDELKDRFNKLKNEFINETINEKGICFKYAEMWGVTETSVYKYIKKIKKWREKGLEWDEILKIKIKNTHFT